MSTKRAALAAISFGLAGFIIGMLAAVFITVGTSYGMVFCCLLIAACLAEGIVMFIIMELNDRGFDR